MGEPRRLLDLLLRGISARVSDVLRQRAMEQHRVLRHKANRAPKRFLRDVGHVLTVDQNAPAIKIVKPLDQLHEGGFAGARMADKPDPLARRNNQREILINRL